MKGILFNCIALCAAMTFATSCEKDNGKGNGDVTPVKNDVVVNASDYFSWNYFNLKEGKVNGTLKYEKEGDIYVIKGDESSMDWDIAIHRGDLKTNGGSVLATGKTDMAQVTEISQGEYVSDIESDKIIVDMSQMMQGIIGYGKSMVNPALMTWYSSEGMPPAYKYTKEVFVLKTKGGEHYKIQFTTYKGDPTGEKSGHIAFNYEKL